MKVPDAAPRELHPREPRTHWCKEASPWGCPWEDLIEHRDWWSVLSGPPFRSASILRRAVLRRPPGRLPRVLGEGASLDGSRGLLTGAFARLLDGGAGPALTALDERTTEDVLWALSAVREARWRDASGADARVAERLSALLSPAADNHRSALLRLATELTQRRRGPNIELYAPLYLSNACTNRCTYCGFAFGNDMARKILSLEEMDREVSALLGSGIQEVLLVCGEAPKLFGPKELAAAARRVRGSFPRVGLEVFPMAESGYAQLRAVGVDALTIYQETYDPERYHQVHSAGRKRDFLWRLGTPERAAAAGLTRIGLGALLGLSPWRFEALALGLHAATLQRLFPTLRLTFSFPRLRPATGLAEVMHPVDDAALLHMMSALRLVLPEVGFVLSTRERESFRDRVGPALIDKMSAGSCTEPGGYSRREAGALRLQGSSDAQQFAIEDTRSPQVFRRALRELGVTPVG